MRAHGLCALLKDLQNCSAAANELDARGINRDSTQQKLAEVGQTMKDYGAVGQQRAGEYLSQAVDQVDSKLCMNLVLKRKRKLCFALLALYIARPKDAKMKCKADYEHRVLSTIMQLLSRSHIRRLEAVLLMPQFMCRHGTLARTGRIRA